jgi:hypothetical protein
LYTYLEQPVETEDGAALDFDTHVLFLETDPSKAAESVVRLFTKYTFFIKYAKYV